MGASKETTGNRVASYFNSIARVIAAQASASSFSSTHKPDIGDNREIILREFLNKHLPRRLLAYIGGQVTSLDAGDSGQIDILITGDVGPRFEQDAKTFVLSEALAAAIAVKSFLSKEELVNALDNLYSIPFPDPKAVQLLVSEAEREVFLRYFPALYVFAYDGASTSHLEKCASEYFESHPNIPSHRYPKGIIVNMKTYVKYCRKGEQTGSGFVFGKDVFYGMDIDSRMAGYPFAHLFADFEKYVGWLSVMRPSIVPYLRQGYGI